MEMTGAHKMPDAFIEAADAARRRLIQRRGEGYSWRRVIAEAGIPDNRRAGAQYHLNPQEHHGQRKHHVPIELVKKLATVLGEERELTKAAAAAQGITLEQYVLQGRDVVQMVVRFYGNMDVSEEERDETTDALLAAIAGEKRRRRKARSRRKRAG
jgi:hypothetical protein